MIRFIADIVGSEILLFQEQALLGRVQSLVFSPNDGSVLGIMCFDPIKKMSRFIVSSEIKRAVGGRILVSGYDSLEDVADLIRVKEAMEVGAKILKELVYTESGQKLGRVTGATVDMTAWRLSRLYVDSSIGLKFLTKALLIPAKKIVRIEKEQIIVTDDYAKIRTPGVIPAPKPILD